MAFIKKEVLLTVLQFLKEENLQETAHMLERETGCFFDMKHFENMVVDGKFDEAEKYLSGFTHVHENPYSTRIFFELRKQKFLEALDKNQRGKALQIVIKDFTDFNRYNESLYKDATLMLTSADFRKCGELCTYGEPKIERKTMMNAVKGFVEMNPLLKGKLQPANPATANSAALMHLVMYGIGALGAGTTQGLVHPPAAGLNYASNSNQNITNN